MTEPQPSLDPQLIDDAVAFINNAVAEKVFSGSLEIGAYVLKVFFNNDIALAAARDSNKPVSFIVHLCDVAQVKLKK